ncbi:MAG: ABC transporter permease [Simkaniaceae bacterium]|nr:ABC transporter permease [Candidatus Sacchlamyda saccharinae]
MAEINVVIQARRPWYSVDFKELISFRWVLVMLVVRDIKLRYKQTLLGALWVVLQPLLTAALFSVIFGKELFVFSFCGLVPWLFFSGALQRGSNSLIGDAKLITKVYFPRVYLPTSATLGMGIDFLIGLSVLFGLLILNGVPLTHKLFFVPAAILTLLLFSISVNLLFSAAAVYFRDVKHILPFLVQLWMFASPLFYNVEIIPEPFRLLYCINPLVGIIEAFRYSFLGHAFPLFTFTLSTILTLFLFLISVIVFQRVENNFADSI